MRVEFLKPLNDWEDIYGGGLIKRYTKCPPSLEKHTLPDWAAQYDCEKTTHNRSSNDCDSDNVTRRTILMA